MSGMGGVISLLRQLVLPEWRHHPWRLAVAVLSERFGSYVTGATMVVDGGIALHNWIDP